MSVFFKVGGGGFTLFVLLLSYIGVGVYLLFQAKEKNIYNWQQNQWLYTHFKVVLLSAIKDGGVGGGGECFLNICFIQRLN